MTVERSKRRQFYKWKLVLKRAIFSQSKHATKSWAIFWGRRKIPLVQNLIDRFWRAQCMVGFSWDTSVLYWVFYIWTERMCFGQAPKQPTLIFTLITY